MVAHGAHGGQREAGTGLGISPHEIRTGRPIYRAIDACRSCGGDRLTEVLDLGMHALSSFRQDPAAPLDSAPLVMVRCQGCTLVQLRHTVDRDRLYSKYFYRSATNESMVAALRDVVADVCSRVRLEPGDVVLDIGANDGTLLRQYAGPVLKAAVEPARDFRDALTSVAEVVVPDYFPPAQKFASGFKAKIITSCAQFYNVEDPNAYVAEIARILHPEGVWVVQMQDMHAVLDDRAFDYICHEHLALWDVLAFDRLIAPYGLEIADVSRNDVNGGSVRLTVMHGPRRWRGLIGADRLVEDARLEWLAFRRDVLLRKRQTLLLLRRLRDEGKVVGGYAASTKGNTTLQFYGIGTDLVPWIADRNPDKVGTYVPTGQRVISEEEMRALKPDALLVLAWHFLPSFLEREQAFLDAGGQFIVPMPELRVVGAQRLAKAA